MQIELLSVLWVAGVQALDRIATDRDVKKYNALQPHVLGVSRALDWPDWSAVGKNAAQFVPQLQELYDWRGALRRQSKGDSDS